MYRRTAIATLVAAAFAAAPVVAAKPARADSALDLSGAIELVAQQFPGRTIAAQVDPAGGESVHYHVDVLMPTGRVARLDVDARTGKVANRLPPEEAPADALTLGEAVKATQKHTRGRVLSAEFDPDPQPHYHMNVRMPKGQLARYDMDLQSRALSPHKPR